MQMAVIFMCIPLSIYLYHISELFHLKKKYGNYFCLLVHVVIIVLVLLEEYDQFYFGILPFSKNGPLNLRNQRLNVKHKQCFHVFLFIEKIYCYTMKKVQITYMKKYQNLLLIAVIYKLIKITILAFCKYSF